MKFQSYLHIKSSGVEWLGEVPAHWEIRRSDGFVESERLQVAPEIFAREEVFHYSIPAVQEFGTGLVEHGESIASSKQVITEPVVLVSRLNPRKATICLAEPKKLRTLASTEFVILKARKVDLVFLEYLVSSEIFRQRLDSYVQSVTRSHQRASPEHIYTFWAAWPNIDEQHSIVKFLNFETKRLDRLIGEKLMLIERLQEKRSALISHTVSRGLTLPAGVSEELSSKFSGVPWLSDVPAHWEIRKFSREIEIAEGQVDPEKEPYSSMLLIGPEHVESGTGRLLLKETAADQAAESGKYYCRLGDVVYSKIRPALRKVVIAPENCLCSADMYPLRSRGKFLNRFIYWLFLSQQFSAWSVLEADRVAMPKINRDTLNELRLPVPPLKEQLAIAEFLETETFKMDALIGKVSEAVERLQEYRTAIVTAVVTGKIDVRKALKS